METGQSRAYALYRARGDGRVVCAYSETWEVVHILYKDFSVFILPLKLKFME